MMTSEQPRDKLTGSMLSFEEQSMVPVQMRFVTHLVPIGNLFASRWSIEGILY